MMVPFFGILQPLVGNRHKADEAPNKLALFGPAKKCAAVQSEENEQSLEEDAAAERRQFLLQSFSPHY